LSADDLHRTAGVLVFGVGREVAGRTLLSKVAVVAAIGFLGLLNHARVRRTAGKAWRSRTVVVEAALAVVALGLSAVVTSGQPAGTSYW
jgi:putative copper export protein